MSAFANGPISIVNRPITSTVVEVDEIELPQNVLELDALVFALLAAYQKDLAEDVSVPAPLSMMRLYGLTHSRALLLELTDEVMTPIIIDRVEGKLSREEMQARRDCADAIAEGIVKALWIALGRKENLPG